jgi:hypothetical protein
MKKWKNKSCRDAADNNDIKSIDKGYANITSIEGKK